MDYEQVLMFLFVELTIYFESKCFVQKVLYEKKCEYIRAQISSLLHVYKCVCTCIFVCV